MALAAALCSAAAVLSPVAARPATAQVCAKADLALMHKLSDEHGTSTAAPGRLVLAAMQMIEARAACRAGDYEKGVALYSDAEKLTAQARSEGR
jgi:hypothetical protein